MGGRRRPLIPAAPPPARSPATAPPKPPASTASPPARSRSPGSSPPRDLPRQLLGPQVVLRPACQHNDLRVQARAPQDVAEPRKPPRVGLHELVVEDDGALELFGDREANERGKLLASPDGERVEDVPRAGASRTYSFRRQRGCQGQRAVATVGELAEARCDGAGEGPTEVGSLRILHLAKRLEEELVGLGVDLELLFARAGAGDGILEAQDVFTRSHAADLRQGALGVMQ